MSRASIIIMSRVSALPSSGRFRSMRATPPSHAILNSNDDIEVPLDSICERGVVIAGSVHGDHGESSPSFAEPTAIIATSAAQSFAPKTKSDVPDFVVSSGRGRKRPTSTEEKDRLPNQFVPAVGTSSPDRLAKSKAVDLSLKG